jgi:hypothetical protein
MRWTTFLEKSWATPFSHSLMRLAFLLEVAQVELQPLLVSVVRALLQWPFSCVSQEKEHKCVSAVECVISSSDYSYKMDNDKSKKYYYVIIKHLVHGQSQSHHDNSKYV